jgi:hypothetical protein
MVSEVMAIVDAAPMFTKVTAVPMGNATEALDGMVKAPAVLK